MSRIPEFGRRGEGWVALQLFLFGAIVGCSFAGVYWPHAAESFLAVLGFVVAAAGLVALVLGAVALGRSFTPLPRPHARAQFREGGPYRFVRHPIYGSVILVAFGWSIAEAPVALAPSGLLAVLFDLKSRREEAWLVERYPAYASYRERTRRFVPLIY